MAFDYFANGLNAPNLTSDFIGQQACKMII